MGRQGTVLHACRDQGGAPPLLAGAQAIPVLPAGARPSRRPAYGSKPDSSAQTHTFPRRRSRSAPAQKPPALPPVPFGGSPGLFTRARPLPQAWQSGVGSTPNARPRSVRFASGRADRLSRKASCVPVRPSGGPGFPLRRPSFFRQGELVASLTEAGRAPSPLVFPERACRLAACRISWL